MRITRLFLLCLALPFFIGCPANVPQPVEEEIEEVVVQQPLVSTEITEKATARIKAMGGSFQKNSQGDVVSASIDNNDVSIDDIKLAAQLTELTNLSLVGPTITDEFVAELAPLKKLRQLRIENTNITSAAIAMLSGFPELRNLNIRRNVNLDGDALKALTKIAKLERLELLYNNFSLGALVSNLPKIQTLKMLDLRGIDSVDNSVIKRIAQLENLEELRVRKSVSDAGVEHLIACKNLKTLDFQDTSLTEKACDYFRQMPNLKNLRIFRDTNFGPSGIEALEGMQNLESLMLRDLVGSSDAVAKLKGLANLKSLELSELTDVNSEDVIGLLKTLPKIEKVRFFAVPFDDSVAKHLATMPQLKDIGMPSTAITDVGLEAICTLPNLVALDIFGNKEKLTLKGAQALAKLKGLRKLTLPETLRDEKLFEEIKKNSPQCEIIIRTYSQET